MGALFSSSCQALRGLGWVCWTLGPCFLGAQAEAEQEEGKVRGPSAQMLTLTRHRGGHCCGAMDMHVGRGRSSQSLRFGGRPDSSQGQVKVRCENVWNI